MIWQSGQWGHVAVCEELIDTNTIAWSQSNYGGAAFEYVKGNANGYKGKTYTVQQVSGSKALIKEITSWVKTSDLQVTGAATVIAVGKKIKVKKTAKTYVKNMILVGVPAPKWLKEWLENFLNTMTNEMPEILKGKEEK